MEAIDEFTEAIQLDPQNGLAYLGRGEAHFHLTYMRHWHLDYHGTMWSSQAHAPRYTDVELSWDKSRSDFSEAIRLGPTLVAAYFERAHVYRMEWRLDECIADLKQVISLDPASDRAKDRLAECYVDRGKKWVAEGKHEKAIADYNAALTLDPSEPDGGFGSDFFEWRGTAFLLNGQIKEAIEDYIRLIEMSGDDIDDIADSLPDEEDRVWMNEAKQHKERGDRLWVAENYQNAVKEYIDAVNVEPGFTPGFTRAIVENMERTLTALKESDFLRMLEDPATHEDALYNHMQSLPSGHPDIGRFNMYKKKHEDDGNPLEIKAMHQIWKRLRLQ